MVDILNLDKNPYYDTFEKVNNYIQVLFKPGRAVQSRELNELQSVLQSQVAQMGSHLFKDGSVVIGGDIAVDYPQTFEVVVEAGKDIKDYINKQLTITDGTSTSTFLLNEYNEVDAGARKYLLIGSLDTASLPSATLKSGVNTIATATDDGSGNIVVNTGVRATVKDGIYFISGRFIQITSQSVVLSTKDHNKTSKRVGLKVDWNTYTSANDKTLTDPASNSLNAGGIGADRLKYTLTLVGVDYNESPTYDFVELLKMRDGNVEKHITKTVYSELKHELARRTYEESGDYVSGGLECTTARSKDGNGIVINDNYIVETNPGDAYIKGYEVDVVSKVTSESKLLLETSEDKTGAINTKTGTFLHINNVNGFLDLSSPVEVSLLSSSNSDLGTVTAYGVVDSDLTGYIKLLVRNIRPNASDSLNNVKKIKSKTGSDLVSADVALSTSDLSSSGTFIMSGADDDSITFLKQIKDGVIFKTRYYFLITSGGTAQTTNTFNISDITGGVIDTSKYTVKIDSDIGSADIMSANGVKNVTFGHTNNRDSVTITHSNIASGKKFYVPIPIELTTSLPVSPNNMFWTKTLQETTIEVTSTNTDMTPNIYDGYKVVSAVVEDNGGNVVNSDVTSSVVFDNGMTDNSYGKIKVSVTSDVTIPAGGKVKVKISYFAHDYSKPGSFCFAPNSYPSGISNVFYKSSGGFTTNLRESLDFRKQDNISPLVPYSAFKGVFEYKMPRKDIVVLDTRGNVSIKHGTSSVNPVTASVSNDEQALYEVLVPANNNNPLLVKKVSIDRYTMSDIKDIADKVTKIEEDLKLTDLEQQASSLLLLKVDGSTRFKNGILVDDFKNTNSLDVKNSKCQVGYDSVLKDYQLLPKRKYNSPIEVFNIEGVLDSKLSNTNGLVTFKESSTENFIPNIPASDTYLINPYQASNWMGQLKLTPSSDIWSDTIKGANVVKEIGSGIQSRTETKFVKEDANIEFIRKKDIKVEASGLRPFTKFKAYFDDTDVTSKCSGLTGGVLVSNEKGEVNTTFSLEADTYKVSTKTFVLIDIDSAPQPDKPIDTKNAKTFAREQYKVNYTGVKKEFSVTTTYYFDPLAQTFNIPNDAVYGNGVFVKNVELYINIPTASPTTHAVTVQIRPVVNGYPSSTEIVSGSSVSVPGASLKSSKDASVSTVFTFDKPVHLPYGEYAVVVLSQSNDYKCFISDIGGNEIGTGKLITSQPYLGSLFKSQNARTWTADQNKDLKFKLNVMKFTHPTAQVNLKLKSSNQAEWKDETFKYPSVSANVDSFSKTNLEYKLTPKSALRSTMINLDEYIELDTTYSTNDMVVEVGLSSTDSGERYYSPSIDVNSLNVKTYINSIDVYNSNTPSTLKSYYTTNPITLAQDFDSSAMVVMFDFYRPVGSDAIVQVKNVGENTWKNIPVKFGYGDKFSRADGQQGEKEVIKYVYELNNIAPKLKSFNVRIILSAKQESKSPFIRDLKIIALED